MNNGHYSYISLLSLIVISFFLLFFNPDLYDTLSREDHLIEYLTSVGLFFAGLLLFLVVFNHENDRKTKLLMGVVGFILIFAAAEEISWGQRIIGFETPEFIASVNEQNEANIHNIEKHFFDRLLNRSIVLFSFLNIIFLFLSKYRLGEIPLPSFALVTAFTLIPLYHQYNSLELRFYHFQYLALLLLLIIALKKKSKWKTYIISSAICLALLLFVFHYYFNHLFPAHNNSANEYREFFFSVISCFYAFKLWKYFRP